MLEQNCQKNIILENLKLKINIQILQRSSITLLLLKYRIIIHLRKIWVSLLENSYINSNNEDTAFLREKVNYILYKLNHGIWTFIKK